MVTRQDLSLPYQAVQSGHASVDFQYEHPEIAKDWQQNSNYLIFLSVESEHRLERLASKAESKGILITRFHEPDINNELTAVAFEPSDKSKRILSNVKLLGKEIKHD